MTSKTRWGEVVEVLHPNPALLKLAKMVAENLKDCPTCGDRRAVAGLTVKCRDWHEVCQCGARFDEPKAAGCRRRKHRKVDQP